MQEGESRQQSLRRQLHSAREQLDHLHRAMAYLKTLPHPHVSRIMEHVLMAEQPVATLLSLESGLPEDTLTWRGDEKPAIYHGLQMRLAYELSAAHPSAYPMLMSVENAALTSNNATDFAPSGDSSRRYV